MANKSWLDYHNEERALRAKAKLEQTKQELGVKEPDNLLVRCQGSLYLVNRQRGRVLDIGRAILMDIEQGIISTIETSVLDWESKRRILHSSPSINMTLVQQALGVDNGPALPMMEGQANWLPQLSEWREGDE